MKRSSSRGASLDAQAVGQQVEGARIGLPGQGVAVDRGPVLRGARAPWRRRARAGGGPRCRRRGASGRRCPRAASPAPSPRPRARRRCARGRTRSRRRGRGRRPPTSSPSAVRLLGHAVAQLGVARALAAQPLDLAARLGRREGLPDRVQGVAARLRPAVGLAAAAADHHLRVLARRRPPGGPLRFRHDAGQGLADLAGGERPVVALEGDPQQLRRRQRGERLGLLQLAPQHVVRRQRLEQLGRGLEADGQAVWRSKSTLKLSRPRLTSTTRPTPLPSIVTTVPTSKASRVSSRSTFSQVLGMSWVARCSPSASARPWKLGRSP